MTKEMYIDKKSVKGEEKSRRMSSKQVHVYLYSKIAVLLYVSTMYSLMALRPCEAFFSKHYPSISTVTSHASARYSFRNSQFLLRAKGPNNPGSDYGGEDDEGDFEDDRVVPSIGSKSDPNGLEDFFDNEDGVSPDVYAQLEPLWENILTQMAIDTSAYYMKEFRDDIPCRWMQNFKNLKNAGWEEMNWRDYIEAMIDLDPFFVQVRMSPPKAYLNGNQTLLAKLREKNDPTNRMQRIKIQYDEKIDPRKIAHGILTIRESVGKEMYKDLQSIPGSNAEAARYARCLMTEGLEAAEKSRRLTRLQHEGGSTPLREKSFQETNVLILNIALDLVKGDLAKDGSESALESIKFLDEFTANATVSTRADALERLDEERLFHRSLLEQLHYRGITEGASSSINTKVNILALSQSLMSQRAAVARDFRKIITQCESTSRSYYKTIKDNGGFKKFDLSARPNFAVIDLDKEEEQAAAANLFDLEEGFAKTPGSEDKDEEQTPESASEDVTTSTEPEQSSSVVTEEFDEEELYNPDAFGQSGPGMM